MKAVIFIIIISFCSFLGIGQSKDSLNFSYWTPKTWFSGDKIFQKENLNNYQFSKKQIDQLVNEVNTSSVLGIYYKYDPQQHYGLVPTMKFYIRQNFSDNFEQFFQSMKKEIENSKALVLDFKYVINPKTTSIGGRKAFYATSIYNIKVQTGELASVRTTFICVPFGKKFFYATLMDNEMEDCTAVYQQVIEQIKID